MLSQLIFDLLSVYVLVGGVLSSELRRSTWVSGESPPTEILCIIITTIYRWCWSELWFSANWSIRQRTSTWLRSSIGQRLLFKWTYLMSRAHTLTCAGSPTTTGVILQVHCSPLTLTLSPSDGEREISSAFFSQGGAPLSLALGWCGLAPLGWQFETGWDAWDEWDEWQMANGRSSI